MTDTTNQTTLEYAFETAFKARFPQISLYWSYEDYRDRDERDDYELSYDHLPAPAPRGRQETAESIPGWLQEHCFQEMEWCPEDAWRLRTDILDSVDVSTAIKMIARAVNEAAEDGYYLIETEQQQEERRMAAQREALEPIAGRIAKKHDVKVGSVSFVSALVEEIRLQEEEEEARQYGMKEDGLCIGWGASVEQWQDEYQSTNPALLEARTLLEWVKEFQPLLYSTWEMKKGN